MNKTNFADFTGKYSLSKTIRFELKPVGNTLANIEKKGLITEDAKLAASYQKMKATIDDYHKHFIEIALADVELPQLDEYFQMYQQPATEADPAAFEKVKVDLRKEIVKCFSSGKAKGLYKNLFTKELLKDDLENWIHSTGNADHYFDARFKNFTTYFTGFNENRENMYSAEPQTTAIAYRIVHENLPKFADNIRLFRTIKVSHPGLDFSPILTEMEELVQGRSLEEMFEVSFFNNLLSQRGIDFINYIIGGRTLESGKKIKGLNEYINLYNQQQPDKKNRVAKFKLLYKQILSDRSSISFQHEPFKSDAELLDAVNSFYRDQLFEFIEEDKPYNVFQELTTLLAALPGYELDKIHLRNDSGITTISQRLFGDFAVIGNALEHYYTHHVDKGFATEFEKAKNDAKREKLNKKMQKFTKQAYFDIATLQSALDFYVLEVKRDDLKAAYSPTVLAGYFRTHFVARDAENQPTKYDLVSNIYAQYLGVKGMLNIEPTDGRRLAGDKEKVHQLKTFLDAIMDLLHFVKPLHVGPDAGKERDELFFERFSLLYRQLNLVVPIYNKVRNYLTPKPYSTEKIKLNFENVQLLGGWDENKETDYLNLKPRWV